MLPVVVYLHGGSWRAGDKDNVALKPAFFTGEGYVFISVNYRLSPNPPDTTLVNAVRFPEHPRNAAKAVSWIYNNIHQYNGDKHKTGITGHSAGGHIAAVVASNPDFLDAQGVPNQIPCVCIPEFYQTITRGISPCKHFIFVWKCVFAICVGHPSQIARFVMDGWGIFCRLFNPFQTIHPP